MKMGRLLIEGRHSSRLWTEGRHYVVVAFADRYIAEPLPLRRDENSELLER